MHTKVKIVRSNVLSGQPEAYIKGWKDYERAELGQPVTHPRHPSTPSERAWVHGFNDRHRYFEGHYTQKNA